MDRVRYSVRTDTCSTLRTPAHRLQVSLPPTGSTSRLHTLASLKNQIAQITSVPPEEQKLVYHGLILKDGNASLRSYNIRSGSRVMLVGSVGDKPGDKVSSHFANAAAGGGGAQQQQVPRQMTKGEILAEEKRKKEADRSEEGVTARIAEVLQNVEVELKPQLEQFQRDLASDGGAAAAAATPTPTATTSAATPQATQQPQPTPSSPQPPSQTHRVLNELFSRALLSLDAIPTVSDSTRQKRKEAVRAVQSYIDQLDSAWDKRK